MTYDLNDAAKQIVTHLRAAGFPQRDERERQCIAMVEEAGEFAGAARRWMGWARREGTFGEMAGELADVAITAHVTAVVFALTIPDPEEWTPGRRLQPRQATTLCRVVSDAVDACERYDDGSGSRSEVGYALSLVLAVARVTADVFGIDLDAAVEAKLPVMFGRGWRDERTENAA